MANSVDPDEISHYETSHLDLRCLQKCMLGSAMLKGLMQVTDIWVRKYMMHACAPGYKW